MDGVAAMVSVLTADSALVALVPAGRIQAGDFPLGTALPAIAVASISVNDRNIICPGSTRYVRQRVQVTVIAASYPAQREILGAVRKAAADRLAVPVPGLSGVVIHTDGQGPDRRNETAGFYIGSQDFRVQYSEQR